MRSTTELEKESKFGDDIYARLEPIVKRMIAHHGQLSGVSQLLFYIANITDDIACAQEKQESAVA